MREKEFLPLVSSRLGIQELNEMQRRMMLASTEKNELILLSPTGSGKTLAFTLTVLKWLNPPAGRVQAVVLCPSRELTVQISGVMRQLAEGFKVTSLYGGHSTEDEKNSLSVTPDIIVSTPGRLLDHLQRGNINLTSTRILVLDEFDKCLELGFQEEMSKIVKRLKNASRFILTSATRTNVLPEFLNMKDPKELDFTEGDRERKAGRLHVRKVVGDDRDKLESLLKLLESINRESERPERTIVFVNHRESAERVAEFLKKRKVSVSLYHGALDQRDRETALNTFNNGSRPILVATDLAARGLDIENVASIIHYHQPPTPEAFIHRNGRSARVDREGDVYLLLGPDEEARPFVEFDSEYGLGNAGSGHELRSGMETLVISAGKKEKLSRGDIVGFLAKECGVEGDRIGKIQVYDHYSLVALPTEAATRIIREGENRRIKGEKRHLSLAR